MNVESCPGQCTNNWNYSTTPLVADTNGCSILVHYRWRECVVNGVTIREVELTRIDKVMGGNCDNVDINALLAIATKAVLYYSSGIFLIDAPGASLYDVTLYTPACWKEASGGEYGLTSCDGSPCCTTKVTMQTINGMPQAVNQILIPPYPQNFSGLVGQTCEYICEAQQVPLNQPLIPWHIDYSNLCVLDCNSEVKFGYDTFQYGSNVVFVSYAYSKYCIESGCPPFFDERSDYFRLQVIGVQIIHLNTLTLTTYEYLYWSHRKAVRKLFTTQGSINVKVLVKPCWVNFGTLGPDVYYSYPCSPPNECCYSYFLLYLDQNGVKILRKCPNPTIYEPNDCSAQPCTYGCNWLYNCPNNSPWSYCDLLNESWGGYLKEGNYEPKEKITLPMEKNTLSLQIIEKTMKIILPLTSYYYGCEFHIQIFDIIGNLILAKNIEVKENENEIILQVNNLPKGLYFIKIFSSRGYTYYGKFIYHN